MKQNAAGNFLVIFFLVELALVAVLSVLFFVTDQMEDSKACKNCHCWSAPILGYLKNNSKKFENENGFVQCFCNFHWPFPLLYWRYNEKQGGDIFFDSRVRLADSYSEFFV